MVFLIVEQGKFCPRRTKAANMGMTVRLFRSVRFHGVFSFVADLGKRVHRALPSPLGKPRELPPFVLAGSAKALTLLISLLVLGGCSYPQLEAHKVSWTFDNREHLGLKSAQGEALEARTVTFRGAWQVEEYVRAVAEDFEAELILAFTPAHETLSLDYSMTLKDFVNSWNFNRDRPKEWLTADRFYRRPATFFYRRYRLPDVDRECVGYTASWRQKADDPRSRPSRLSFGYFCLMPSAVLSADAAETLLRRIEIRLERDAHDDLIASRAVVDGGLVGEIPAPCLLQAGSERNVALDFAQGVPPCNTAGNPRFPFKFAMHYNIPNGKVAR